MVSVRDFRRFDKQRLAPLHVRKANRPLERKLHFKRIEQMKRGHIVLAKSQVLETALQDRRVDEEVRDNDHQSTLANRFCNFVQDGRQLRVTRRFGVFKRIENDLQMGSRASRRNVLNNLFGNARQPDRVPLLGSQVRHRSCDLPRVFDLRGMPFGSISHRSTGIDHDAASQIRVGLKLLDVVSIGSPKGTPVETSQVVAGYVLSILSELDARCGDECLPEILPCMACRDMSGTAASRDRILGSRNERAVGSICEAFGLFHFLDQTLHDLLGGHAFGLGSKRRDDSVR